MTMASINPTQRLVLAVASLDGGATELTGIDARKWMTKAHDTAARQLHIGGFGRYDCATPFSGARFTIGPLGRDALS